MVKLWMILKVKRWSIRASLVAQWLSPPANAGDTGSSPGLGGSHMPRSGWAREPQLLSLRVWSLCSAAREAAIARGPRTAMKSGPRLPQLEKALAQKRRPNTAINKNKLKKKKKRWLAGHQSRLKKKGEASFTYHQPPIPLSWHNLVKPLSFVC